MEVTSFDWRMFRMELLLVPHVLAVVDIYEVGATQPALSLPTPVQAETFGWVAMTSGLQLQVDDLPPTVLGAAHHDDRRLSIPSKPAFRTSP